MDEDQGQERAPVAEGDQGKSAAQLRAEIEEVREDLGDTAAALAAKTDVKARARDRAEEIKQSATARKDDLLSKTPLGSGTGSGTSSPDAGPGALDKLRAIVSEHPVAVAAVGALAAGFLLGRITGRERY